MARNWIVVGDPTSSGGSVITASPFTDIDGIPVSRVTDQATCPRHKGVYPIVDGDPTMIIDGHPVALHGSSWPAAARCCRRCSRGYPWMLAVAATGRAQCNLLGDPVSSPLRWKTKVAHAAHPARTRARRVTSSSSRTRR